MTSRMISDQETLASYTNLVAFWSRRFSLVSGLLREDLYQDGWVACLEAVSSPEYQQAPLEDRSSIITNRIRAVLRDRVQANPFGVKLTRHAVSKLAVIAKLRAKLTNQLGREPSTDQIVDAMLARRRGSGRKKDRAVRRNLLSLICGVSSRQAVTDDLGSVPDRDSDGAERAAMISEMRERIAPGARELVMDCLRIGARRTAERRASSPVAVRRVLNRELTRIRNMVETV